MAKKKQNRDIDERSPELKGDLEARADELRNDSREVGEESAGHGGELQRLSPVEEANEESVEELADTNQSLEAAVVEGVEDAADHPERPVHTHEEYGRPDDIPPARRDDEAA
jgi:sugar phosphate isomerase/epimerase